jgi:iron-sulfur cluster repair protein YtfE (RIC family)
MVLQPSEIRAIILDEHGALRSRLNEIEADLVRTATDAAALGRLQEQLQRFYELFLRHIAREEEILKPVLRDIDNWGPYRIERMDEEHVEQRRTIAALSRLVPDPDPSSYTETICDFIRDLRLDMDAEERDFLSKDVLRDDSINIDAFGG